MRRSVSVLLGLLAAAIVPASAEGRNVVAHDVAQSPSEVRAYWTPERMRAARPRDLREPKAKPGGGNGGGGGGRSYGAVKLINGSYQGEMAKNGKVFLTERGVNYVCSGTSIATGSAQAVWTAGHCVHEGPGSFVTNWQFVPGYVDGAAPYGTYPATRLFTTSGWSSSGDFDYDLGAAAVSGDLAGTVGGRSVATNYEAAGLHVIAYGYPAEGKFSGYRQHYCDSSVTRRDAGDPQPMGIACNMSGGSSGGGWINDFGFLVSVNSYGYQNLKNVMFGPYQDSVAGSLAACARGGACDATVLGS